MSTDKSVSEHIFAPNGDHCLYYPSNLFRNERSFENWGILNNYSPKWTWLVVDIYSRYSPVLAGEYSVTSRLDQLRASEKI